tara:strand:+ start:104 stop:496 length:393 start_codon:yes stop_codon:yes gene_type:complete
MDKKNLKNISLALVLIMFIYSGFTKIFNFTKKVNTLQKKTSLPHSLNVIGMVLVIILEIVGSVLLLVDGFNTKKTYVSKDIINMIYIQFMVFLVVVTMLYHPPGTSMIPFLSNLTTLGAFAYIYSDKFIQ